MLTAVAELVGGLVLTVAADLLVEQLVYYEKDKRGAQPKGLLTYVTAARKIRKTALTTFFAPGHEVSAQRCRTLVISRKRSLSSQI